MMMKRDLGKANSTTDEEPTPTDSEPRADLAPAKQPAKDGRDQRLADALRSNLKRRKAQANRRGNKP
jgi:hypothetical protein